MRQIMILITALALSAAIQAGEKEDVRYRVVINHEEQYSIWFADREIPAGWKDAKFVGTRDKALAYIEEVWTDMRPLNRRRMAEENLKRLQKNRPRK